MTFVNVSLNQKITNLDASFNTEIDSLKVSIQDLSNSIIPTINSELEILDASLVALVTKDTQIDASLADLVAKDTQIDASLADLVTKDGDIDNSLNVLFEAVFTQDLSSQINQNMEDISDNKSRILNISNILFESNVSLTDLLDRSNTLFANLDPSYNILAQLQNDMKEMRVNLQVEGERDQDKVVFSTGMGGPIEDMSGTVPAYGIPVLDKCVLDEVMITSKGKLSNSQPISFTIKVYDSSGMTMSDSSNVSLDTHYKVDTTLNLKFEDAQNQLVMVCNDSNLSTWHSDSRFRITFGFSKDPLLSGITYYND